MKKLKDLSVVVRTYNNSRGEKKNVYQNVGAIFAYDDGNLFIALERWFNPAGIPHQDGRSTIVLNAFEPREPDEARTPAPLPRYTASAKAPPKAAPPADDFDDPLPF